jgi:cell wall-associated NlpC family hydrolase
VAPDAPALVCSTAFLAVRVEPRHDAEQVTQLLEGEPVAVSDVRGDWTEIRTAYGYPGWVASAALVAGPRRHWLTLRDGQALEEARSYLGSPYEWGGMTRRGIDCSGLVHMANRRLGRLVPRDAAEQEEAGLEVSEDEIAPGDLITYGEGQATHIAFWSGGARILHASGGAGRVVEEDEPANLRKTRRKVVRL